MLRNELKELHRQVLSDECADRKAIILILERIILMAEQIDQLTSDAAAQNTLVNATLTDVSAAIGSLLASIASLTAQLAAIGTGNPLPDISAQLATIEANTANIQKIKDAADAAIPPVVPPTV